MYFVLFVESSDVHGEPDSQSEAVQACSVASAVQLNRQQITIFSC
jgi:hypothetical protein